MMPAVAYTRLSKPNEKGKPGIGLDVQQAAITEPPRDCRRPFGLSYAATGVSSSIV